MKVVNLHQHSRHSFLDGMCSIKELLKRAKELGMDSIAITEHGNIFPHIEFYKECKKANIKPILGMEVYCIDDHNHLVDNKRQRHAHHLVLLAENENGWLNLCRLTTRANKNFYYKPRVDFKDLIECHENIIALTACLHGPVAFYLFDHISKNLNPDGTEESLLKHATNMPEAYRYARELLAIFGPTNLFLEVQDGGIPEQKIVNKRIRQMALELGLNTIATQDTHYVLADDAEAHGYLKAIGYGKTAVEAGSHGFSTNEFYLKSRDQMLNGTDLLPEEVDRTLEIAARCNVELKLHQMRLPKYKFSDDKSSIEVLKEKIFKGWNDRDIEGNVKDLYLNRLNKELRDIEIAGLSDYFLIVSDITDYCHSNSIMLGAARGSAGGSLVSYLLKITNLDPIKYNLVWERFYNAGRIGSMPDIDIDVETQYRDQVIEYIKNRFGTTRVAQLVTLSSLGAKGVLKDVCRVAGIDFDLANRISGLVPAKNEDHASISLDEACRMVPLLNEYAQNDNPIEIMKDNKILRKTSWKKLFDVAKRLEGCYKTAGMHAAGVVIADDDFDKVGVPLVKGTTKDDLICGWDMDAVDALGLLKVDILGLATLSVIRTTLGLIKERYGLDIDINHIPLDDKKVSELISSGRNEGVFQLESQLGKNWSKKCKPGLTNSTCIVEEIADLASLIRPAVLEAGFAESYARCKNGEEPVSYIHPKLESILKSTYGVLLYQEQMMAIAHDICGWDLKECDALRKAVGKKKPDEVRAFKDKFIRDAEKSVDVEIANKLWGLVENGGAYGFNRSHAVGYSILAYQTAWLKANYYMEFLCANLIHAKDKASQQRTPRDVIASFINDGKLHDVAVIPPRLKHNTIDFKIIDDKTIAFGFSHIRNVGEAALRSIKACVKSNSFEDFLKSAKTHRMNSQVVEALICAGVLDDFGIPRRSMKNQYNLLSSFTDKELEAISNETSGTLLERMRYISDEDLVDSRKATKLVVPNKNRRAKIRELLQLYNSTSHFDTMVQLLSWEKTYFGTTISGSLADLNNSMNARNNCIEIAKGQIQNGDYVELCVVLEDWREHTIKKGKSAGQVMAFLTISDSSYRLDNTCVFPETFAKMNGLIDKDDVVGVDGTMSNRGLIINRIRRL